MVRPRSTRSEAPFGTSPERPNGVSDSQVSESSNHPVSSEPSTLVSSALLAFSKERCSNSANVPVSTILKNDSTEEPSGRVVEAIPS